MPKPRPSGFSRSMRASSSQMLPPVSGSKPARQLSAVDLPQPDGPSRAMNSPRPTLSVTSRSAFRLPKSRLTPSSRNWRKSRDAAIMPIGLPSLGLRAADLLIPATERIDQLVRQERQLERIVGDQLLVFWPTELLDDLLALRRRHRQRHVLDRRAGIEIAAVIGRRLRLLGEQIGQEIDEHRDFLGRHALGDAEIMRIHDPVEALERNHLSLLRHDTEGARVDVPAHLSRDHVARALAELLHRRPGAGRVVFDRLAEFLEIGPGLVPAVLGIVRVLVAEEIGTRTIPRTAGTR